MERYEQILRLHILPYSLFKRRVAGIGRSDIKKHLRCISVQWSPATVEAVHSVISSIFNEAVDDEILDFNPARSILKNILPPKNQRDIKDPDPFTCRELTLFLSHAESIASSGEVMILKSMAYAGLRLGEALSMRCEYFDPENKTYFVRESYRRRSFRKPKSGKPRLVDLPDFLVHELAAYIQSLKKKNLKMGGGGDVDLLFVDPSETGIFPFSQRKVQGLMKKVCKRSGLRTRNPHDLRHTYATLLLMAHQSPGYVQRQLGHSSISMTMDIYCHWIPGEGRDGLEKAFVSSGSGGVRERQSHIIAYNKKRLQ